MRKNELYQIAKKYDVTISYRRTSKQKFIEIIMNHTNNIDDIKVHQQPIEDNNYTEDYIQDLKNQIEYWKNQANSERIESNKWRDKYYEQLERNQNSLPIITQLLPNQPKNEYNDILNQMKQMMSTMSMIEQPKSNPLQIKVNEEPIEQPKVDNGPFAQIPKLDKKSSGKSIGEVIKINSLIEHTNKLSQKDIEDMKFKTRKEYYENQLKIMENDQKIMNNAENQKSKLKPIKPKLSLMDQIKARK